METPVAPAVAAALDALAPLFAYPSEGFALRAAEAAAALRGAAPEAAPLLDPFLLHVRDASASALEEGHTRTFDWSATCSLELGWHLYGEQYDRGAFLVAMRSRLRAVGVEEGVDLPDHVGACLRWVARAERAEAGVFARSAILPALARVLGGLAKDASPAAAPYAALVRATQALVQRVADAVPAEAGAPPPPSPYPVAGIPDACRACGEDPS